MLKSRVICLYYPIGGVVDTINNHGIKLVKDQEVNQILSLMEDEKHKQKIVDKQRENELKQKELSIKLKQKKEQSNLIILILMILIQEI